MVVVIGFSKHDVDLVRQLSAYMPRLMGYQKNHELVLAADAAVADALPELEEAFRAMFPKVTTCAFKIADAGWPKAPNRMFHCVAHWLRFDHQNTKKPWYYMEPDVTPLSAQLFDSLETEFNLSGKRFLGPFNVTRYGETEEELTVDGHHMVGSAVYAPDFIERTALLRHADSVPWDVYLRWEILPHAAETKLIQHNWGTQNYRRVGGAIVCDRKHAVLGQNEDVRSGAMAVHGCKDGSLMGLLVAEGKADVQQKLEEIRSWQYTEIPGLPGYSREGVTGNNGPDDSGLANAGAPPKPKIFKRGKYFTKSKRKRKAVIAA